MSDLQKIHATNDPLPTPCTRRQFLRVAGGLSLVTLAPAEAVSAAEPPANNETVSLENEVLQITFHGADGSLSVLDKRIGLLWKQRVSPGFKAGWARMADPGFSAKVEGPGRTQTITVSFTPGQPHAFDIAVGVQDHQYATLAGYPFPFAAPEDGWEYVQNTTGEGILMPLAKPEQIQNPYGWGGGQPWWGLTDLKRAMRARLDSFRLPGANDDNVYASPFRINYAFFTEGGYVGLAKEYRKEFLRTHPEMRPLRDRVQERPAVGHLKDSVYCYLWGEKPGEDLEVVREMKAAGIDRGIAVFYGRHETDRATCDGVKELGWVMGKYQMPAANLSELSKIRHWPSALLLGKITPAQLLQSTHGRSWDRVCGKQVLKDWPAKAKGVIDEYGVQLFYFDTLVVQLAPCLSPEHPATIEENLEARRGIMRATREMGMLVGSGEGVCPTWALPEADFFEGLMSLRNYSDNELKIPSGDFKTDLGEKYREAAATQLDETRRIPLYQLAFHDYVAGTWVWRDTNFQSTPYAWKKDLFNILYATMPMWHLSRELWDRHRAEMIASYKMFIAVRQRVGFAEMVNHGWLTADRSVQFTDWETGDRVIVNFGDTPFSRPEQEAIAPRSFALGRV